MTQKNVTPEEVAEKVVDLPVRFRAGAEVSMYGLLTDSGYLEHYHRVSEEMINERLVLAPELVDEWGAYSDDKRTSTGWYFRPSRPAGYEVGYVGAADEENFSEVYPDRFRACAKFIKNELEEMRTHV